MKQGNIKTSIIIPVYNTKDYLDKCMESALHQTQKEIEIILVDDGSTDGSRQLIEAYEEKYAFVKAVYQQNQKLGAARNAGVNAASGKYIYFLDSDDYIREDLCERCYQAMEAQNLDFVMFDASVFVEEGKELRVGSEAEKYVRSHIEIEDRVYSGTEFWAAFYSVGGVFSNAYLVYLRTSFFREHALEFEPGVYYEDMDWVARLYSCAGRIAYISECMYMRRIHAGSIMTAAYTDIHMRSSILQCRKMLQMLVQEQDPAKQDMVFKLLQSMLGRFRDIYGAYCENGKIQSVYTEVLAFGQYLISMYPKLHFKEEGLQCAYLLTAEAISSGLKEFDENEDASGSDVDLDKYKWQMVWKEVQNLPFCEEKKRIGIYGTGNMCKKFLALYRKYIGKAGAAIFFIDTNKESGGCHQGYPLYNVKDVVGMTIDGILITSSRYGDEMLDKVRTYCPADVEVAYVPELINTLFQGGPDAVV